MENKGFRGGEVGVVEREKNITWKLWESVPGLEIACMLDFWDGGW